MCAERDALAKQCAELKKSIDDANLRGDSLYAELMRLQKMSGITEENQRMDINALTDRCLRVTHMMEAETALRRNYEDKANKYDAAETELLKLRKEVHNMLFALLFYILLV